MDGERIPDIRGCCLDAVVSGGEKEQYVVLRVVDGACR
jgi:hypothetical protein